MKNIKIILYCLTLCLIFISCSNESNEIEELESINKNELYTEIDFSKVFVENGIKGKVDSIEVLYSRDLTSTDNLFKAKGIYYNQNSRISCKEFVVDVNVGRQLQGNDNLEILTQLGYNKFLKGFFFNYFDFLKS